MKKLTLIGFLFIIFILSGCIASNNKSTGEVSSGDKLLNQISDREKGSSTSENVIKFVASEKKYRQIFIRLQYKEK